MVARKKSAPVRKSVTKRSAPKRRAAASRRPAVNYLKLAIGATLPGGTFAGITYADGKPFALVLGPEYDGECDWNAFVAWVKGLKSDGCADFIAPSKLDGMLLFTNLRDQFKRETYWLEQHAEGSSCAWGQGFSNGDQSCWDKYGKLRARAVRRIPLSHSAL